ncbi:hypothetical protein ABZ589_23425 [Streptomyces sp. NPDC013313]|uniref:hypothetical protein n=1 Tax=Streptomyces sp. NPDC013313 TaxID=3155603 RepID=UPI0033F9DE8D
MQYEQDALEHQPVGMPLAPRVPSPSLGLRQQWLDHRPQLSSTFTASAEPPHTSRIASTIIS